MNLFLALLISYLLGSIPFSQGVARLVKGVDLRKVGTRNVGGNNLSQNVGAGWGALGGGLDVLKGVAAMALAQWLLPFPQSLAAGLAVVAGHIWPVWLGFRGGKGLATAGGAIAWVAPLEALACMLIWAFVYLVSKNGTNATIAAFVTLGIIFLVEQRPIEIISMAFGIVSLVTIASVRDLFAEARQRGGWKQVVSSHSAADEN